MDPKEGSIQMWREVFWLIASGRCYPLKKVLVTQKYSKIDGVPLTRDGKHLYGIMLETTDFQGNQLYTVKLEPQPYFESKRPHVLDDCVAGVLIKVPDGSTLMLGPFFHHWTMGEALLNCWKWHTAALPVLPSLEPPGREDRRRNLYTEATMDDNLKGLLKDHGMSIKDLFVTSIPIPYPSLAASLEAHSTGSCADETVDADAAGSSKIDTTYGSKQDQTDSSANPYGDKGAAEGSSQAAAARAGERDQGNARSLLAGLDFEDLSIKTLSARKDPASSKNTGVTASPPSALLKPRSLADDFDS